MTPWERAVLYSVVCSVHSQSNGRSGHALMPWTQGMSNIECSMLKIQPMDCALDIGHWRFDIGY